MAATTGKQYSVGMRHARVYPLDAIGRIVAPGTTVYEGLQVTATKAFDMTVPDARRIVHVGDDHIKAQDVLPRIEASSATLRVARNDHDVYAVLTGTKAFVAGEAAGIGYGTDKQGSEPDVAFLLYQQSLDAVAKTRRYRSNILPVSRAIVNPASMNENAVEYQFSLLPQIVTKHLWGIAFTTNVEGFTEAELVEFMTEDIPHVVAFKGDGTALEFSFHASRPAVSTSKIHQVTTTTAAGVTTDVTSTITKAVDKITFAGGQAPAATDIVTVFYEYAD